MEAKRSQPVAIAGKSNGGENGSNARKPLPWVAGCRGNAMGSFGRALTPAGRAS